MSAATLPAANRRKRTVARTKPRLESRTRWNPERLIVLPNVSWKTYVQIDQGYGDDNRPGTRLNYLDGELEIMSTSDDHEQIKKIIGHCIEHFCLDHGIHFTAHGQATRKIEGDRAAEADESYSFDKETRKVQLIVEVVITSGGINKLALYEKLGRPEVWFWRRGKLQPYVHDGTAYRASIKSRVLPGFDIKLVSGLSRASSTYDALCEFRRLMRKTK